MDDDSTFEQHGEVVPEYERLLELEDLESLLEELEEAGIVDDLASAELPGELQARLDEARVADVSGLRERIARLHATADSSEDIAED